MVMHDNEFKTNKGNKIKIKDKIEPQHIFPLTTLDIVMILFKLQSLTYLEQGETRPKGKRCSWHCNGLLTTRGSLMYLKPPSN